MPYNSRPPRSGGAKRSFGERSFGGGSRGGRRPSFGGGNRRKNQKAYIHPSRFVKAAKPRTEVVYEPINKFTDFDVHENIMGNLVTKGFVNPTPIQDQSIPHGLSGRDLVGIADTGTGKTLAFAIPVLHRVLSDPNSRALIMAPTRELAQQIEDSFRDIAKSSGLYGALLIGGTPMGPQLRDLRATPSIVIGTPGRIKDHIERGTLEISGFNTVVLDEVDRMLDMGFVNDMRFILERLASPRQSFFFSATMEPGVQTLIRSFSNDAVEISIKTGETSENVEQDIIPYTSQRDKIEKLHELLNSEVVEKVLVFDETQRNVERLNNELADRGFGVDAIHGGKSQGQRQRALNRFKKNDIKILVATDVAARGIDVADVTHVINYATPNAYEDYVHRVGRAGRAGRIGYAFTFVEAV